MSTPSKNTDCPFGRSVFFFAWKMESKFIPVRGNPSSPTKNTDCPFGRSVFFFARKMESKFIPVRGNPSSPTKNTDYPFGWSVFFMPSPGGNGRAVRCLLLEEKACKPLSGSTAAQTLWEKPSIRAPHTPGARSRAASSRRDRPPTSVSKQSAHTVSPPRTHGHRYASSHDGSGAKHTSHRRIRVPPFLRKIIMHLDNFRP